MLTEEKQNLYQKYQRVADKVCVALECKCTGWSPSVEMGQSLSFCVGEKVAQFTLPLETALIICELYDCKSELKKLKFERGIE